jgi:hypothetical protein
MAKYTVFDESCFNLSYNDVRLCVRCYCSQCNLRSFIIERDSGQTPSAVVWGAIGYKMQSCLLCIEGNVNSDRYIKEEVLEHVVLSLLQSVPHSMCQRGNSHTHEVRIVQAPSSKNNSIPLSLTCKFARHVTHRTCLEYGWSATCLSWSSSNHS